MLQGPCTCVCDMRRSCTSHFLQMKCPHFKPQTCTVIWQGTAWSKAENVRIFLRTATFNELFSLTNSSHGERSLQIRTMVRSRIRTSSYAKILICPSQMLFLVKNKNKNQEIPWKYKLQFLITYIIVI